MDFTLSDKQVHWRDRVIAFMKDARLPAGSTYVAQMRGFGENRWQVMPHRGGAQGQGARGRAVEPVPAAVASVPSDALHGAGLDQPRVRRCCAEEMGRVSFASEVFNCSAPDTGNMEVLDRYGTQRSKERWLRPLLDGRDPLGLPDDRARRSPRPTPPTSRPRSDRDGDHYVINGRKWWSSGVGDPRCKIAIVMGKTDPTAPPPSAAVA